MSINALFLGIRAQKYMIEMNSTVGPATYFFIRYVFCCYKIVFGLVQINVDDFH